MNEEALKAAHEVSLEIDIVSELDETRRIVAKYLEHTNKHPFKDVDVNSEDFKKKSDNFTADYKRTQHSSSKFEDGIFKNNYEPSEGIGALVESTQNTEKKDV